MRRTILQASSAIERRQLLADKISGDPAKTILAHIRLLHTSYAADDLTPVDYGWLCVITDKTTLLNRK